MQEIRVTAHPFGGCFRRHRSTGNGSWGPLRTGELLVCLCSCRGVSIPSPDPEVAGHFGTDRHVHVFVPAVTCLLCSVPWQGALQAVLEGSGALSLQRIPPVTQLAVICAAVLMSQRGGTGAGH